MITKYKACRRAWGNLIEPVQVEKETESRVWIDGRRRAKRSGFDNYFDTWDEAKEFMTEYAEKKLDRARRDLEAAQGLAGNVRGLKAPQHEESK